MRLSRELRQLLFMNATATIIFIYVGIFVNLFIWGKEHKIFDLAWFNLILFTIWSLAFMLGAKLLTTHTIRVLMRISAMFGGIAFLLLAYMDIENRLLWIMFIAVPVGAMWGFYAAAQNLSIVLIAKGTDFANYFAISGLINQMISICIPTTFAFVINQFGYAGSFYLMLGFTVMMLVTSQYIPPISLASAMEQNKKLLSNMKWDQVFFNTSLKWIIPSCIVTGIFLQFQGLFALIFTFSITEDKLIIAGLNTINTTVTLAALFIYRRIHLNDKWWLLVALLLINIGFLIVMYPQPLILITSNILTTIGMFYFGTVWNAQHFHVISEYSVTEQARVLIWREFLLCVSRCFMLLLVLPVAEIKGVMFVSLLVLAMLCSLSIPYFQNKMMQSKNISENITKQNSPSSNVVI